MTEKEQQIISLIQRRRLQILVHANIYHVHGDNLIDDYTYTQWTYELVKLQQKYPELAEQVEYADAFRNYQGASAIGLPYRDDRIESKALQLLRYHDKHNQ